MMLIMMTAKKNYEYDGVAYGDEMVDNDEGRC